MNAFTWVSDFNIYLHPFFLSNWVQPQRAILNCLVSKVTGLNLRVLLITAPVTVVLCWILPSNRNRDQLRRCEEKLIGTRTDISLNTKWNLPMYIGFKIKYRYIIRFSHTCSTTALQIVSLVPFILVATKYFLSWEQKFFANIKFLKIPFPGAE